MITQIMFLYATRRFIFTFFFILTCLSPVLALSYKPPHKTFYGTAYEDLNQLQEFFEKVLQVNEKTFPGKTGQVMGFGAGAGYPQIWLRDSATIIPASRWYYEKAYLFSWLLEHLAHQKPDGWLYDWVAQGLANKFQWTAPHVEQVYREKMENGKYLSISADKNTVCADQETSAVHSAYQYFKITGDLSFLLKDVAGKTVLQRLENSLLHLLKYRFSKKYGLVENAFSADWGDVNPVYSDQRSIYLDENVPKVAGIYTNAMFVRAAWELRDLFGAAGNEERQVFWDKKAKEIKENINRHLWMKGKGFYRMHISLNPKAVPVDDSDFFAMGGNAEAILADVADEEKAKSIFNVTHARKNQYGVSTVASVLLPPYPSGFFKNPVLKEPYTYQNGGQWDWFAGRLIYAEFEHGYSGQALKDLLEIAKKNVENGGFFEWDTKEGKGMGSSLYAGSAGALSLAIIRGYFGVSLSFDSLDLIIRLSKDSGNITAHQPSTETVVHYQYVYNKKQNTFYLSYNSTHEQPGTVSVLLPQMCTLTSLELDSRSASSVSRTVKKGNDIYVSWNTDWRGHTVKGILNCL